MIELAHFGVPGMKWGVRNEKEPVGRRRKSSVGKSAENTTKKSTGFQNFKTDVKLASKVGAGMALVSAALIAFQSKSVSEALDGYPVGLVAGTFVSHTLTALGGLSLLRLMGIRR